MVVAVGVDVGGDLGMDWRAGVESSSGFKYGLGR